MNGIEGSTINLFIFWGSKNINHFSELIFSSYSAQYEIKTFMLLRAALETFGMLWILIFQDRTAATFRCGTSALPDS